MLNIQVLGKGLIPRGLGIAPRKEPFPADYSLIATIMQTHGLKVNMIRPDDGKVVELTPNNVKRMWDKYSASVPKKPRIVEVNMPPQEPEKEKKEPEIYDPNNKNNQNQNGYQEMNKDTIQSAVQEAAASVFAGANTQVPVDPTNESKDESEDEKKVDETSATPDSTDKKDDQEEKKEPENTNNGNKNNNGGKNHQTFKPMNNNKK